MESKKTALVVVDIQNDYFPGGKMTLHNMEQATENAAKLLHSFRQKGLPRFLVRHEAASPELGFMLPGSEGAELHEKVKPQEGDVIITKKQISSFNGTELDAKLKEAGVENLVVCGAMSHMCIDGTVRAAADLGYKCTLIEDACATRDVQYKDKVVPAEDVQAAYLAALGFAYAEIQNADDYLSKH
ncbi:Cysteine hydrolase [Balamuthia mandrillaris]